MQTDYVAYKLATTPPVRVSRLLQAQAGGRLPNQIAHDRGQHRFVGVVARAPEQIRVTQNEGARPGNVPLPCDRRI